MITVKIGKDIKIQKYLIRGIKMFIKIKEKWYCIKFNENEVILLHYIIDIISKEFLR